MKVKIKSSYIIILLIFIINSTDGIIKNIIYFCIFSLCAYQLFLKFQKNQFVFYKDNNIEFQLIPLSALLIIYSLLNMTFNQINLAAIERIFQLVICLFVLMWSVNQSWAYEDYYFILSIIKIILLLCIIVWPFSGYRMNYYQGIFFHGNRFGGSLFIYLSIFLLIPRKYSWIDKLTILTMVLFIYPSNSRSALIAMIVFFIGKFLLDYFQKQKIHYKLLLFLFLIVAILFPFAYLSWFNNPVIFQKLTDLSWTYFRKNFFSGRQLLWEPIIKNIFIKPIIGYGFDITPESIMDTNFSSHNWFLQVLLQAGISGFLLIIGILIIIWNALYDHRKNKIARNTASFLLAVLTWQFFEVSLTQNNLSTGIMVWLVLGMGLRLSYNNFEYNLKESLQYSVV